MTATPLPQLRPEELRPYASFGILQYLGPDESEIVPTILKALMDVCLPSRARRSTRLIAYGLTQADTVARAQTDGLGLQVEAFAYEESRAPSWATGSTALVDIENKIAVVTRRANLVAIHCPRDRVDALQVWLDNEPRPPFVRIAPPVLQQAILQGEARGLWLRGTHRRQTFKADTKNLSGLELRDALDPFDDSSFALTTGRATIPSELGFRSAAGGLGVTLRKSWVWNRQSVSLDHYLGIASEILDLVQGSIANGQPTTMFPELAIEVDSLDHVVGAFEAYFAEPEEVRQLPDVNEELSERAERLRDVVIDIEGEPSDARFTLIVGDAGAECGRLRCTPRINGHTVSVDFRTMSAPSNPSRTAEIRDAAGAGELLTVYYETGHSVSQGGVAIRRQSPVPFQKWKFCSFAGFDIHREKPDGASPQEIHTNVGRDGDTSLFAWVRRQFSSGHLTCDDGANEVADFVQIDADGTLRLIHVKAGSHSAERRCSTGAFEVVVSQAVKNLRYLAPERLSESLSESPIEPAVWSDGQRAGGRDRLLDALSVRSPEAPMEVVIVQPHHTEPRHRQLMDERRGGSWGTELRRLQLIEAMLHAARSSAVGLGADLVAIGAS